MKNFNLKKVKTNYVLAFFHLKIYYKNKISNKMKYIGIDNKGVISMNITKSCFNCGGVVFSILPEQGGYHAVCAECGTKVGEVKLDKYVTIMKNCINCNSSRFKIKVKKGQEEDNWSLECIDCKTEPSFKFVDNSLNEIDEITRENLILKDTVSELQEKIKELELKKVES